MEIGEDISFGPRPTKQPANKTTNAACTVTLSGNTEKMDRDSAR